MRGKDLLESRWQVNERRQMDYFQSKSLPGLVNVTGWPLVMKIQQADCCQPVFLAIFSLIAKNVTSREQQGRRADTGA